MSRVGEALARRVRERGNGRCEYCHFPAAHTRVGFQIDHIIASKHRGITDDSNLAFACYYCNAHKGPNVAGIDPVTGEIIRLFHPRKDVWTEHFRWDGPWLFGMSAMARATIQVLEINDSSAVELRGLLMAEGIEFT